MKADNHNSFWDRIVAPSIVGIIVGLLSFWLSGQVRPNLAKWDVYQRTYDKRIVLYGDLMKLFPDVYYLEQEIKIKRINPGTALQMRIALNKKYDMLIASGVPIMTHDIFTAFEETTGDYLKMSANFTTEERRKWISTHYDKLLKAIRKDVGTDASASFASQYLE
jgi:hypothetical protein